MQTLTSASQALVGTEAPAWTGLPLSHACAFPATEATCARRVGRLGEASANVADRSVPHPLPLTPLRPAALHLGLCPLTPVLCGGGLAGDREPGSETVSKALSPVASPRPTNHLSKWAQLGLRWGQGQDSACIPHAGRLVLRIPSTRTGRMELSVSGRWHRLWAGQGAACSGPSARGSSLPACPPHARLPSPAPQGRQPRALQGKQEPSCPVSSLSGWGVRAGRGQALATDPVRPWHHRCCWVLPAVTQSHTLGTLHRTCQNPPIKQWECLQVLRELWMAHSHGRGGGSPRRPLPSSTSGAQERCPG